MLWVKIHNIFYSSEVLFMSLKLLKDEALAEVSGGDAVGNKSYARAVANGICSPITGIGDAIGDFCGSETSGTKRAEIISSGVSKITASALIGAGITIGAKKLISFVKSKNLFKK